MCQTLIQGWEDRIVLALQAHNLVERQINNHIINNKNHSKCYDGKVQNTTREFLHLTKLTSETGSMCRS